MKHLVGIGSNASAGYRSNRGLIGAILLFVVLLVPAVMVGASSISVGYTTSQSLPTGSIVAPDGQSSGAVVAANATTQPNILGVVVPMGTLSVTQDNTQVQVTNEGTANVLVSDINGPIQKGDKITASPLDGIGMKATDAGKVLGTTQGELSSSTPNVETKTVTNKKGETKQVQVGMVPITLNVGFYQPVPTKTMVPKLIRDISNNISGKEVSAARVWGSLGVLAVSLLIVVVLLYGAVRSSIGAIGRNPLAKSAIQHSMSKVIGLAMFILAVSTGAVYLILKG